MYLLLLFKSPVVDIIVVSWSHTTVQCVTAYEQLAPVEYMIRDNAQITLSKCTWLRGSNYYGYLHCMEDHQGSAIETCLIDL